MAEGPQELSKPGPPAQPPGTRFLPIPQEMIRAAMQGVRSFLRGPEQFSTIKSEPAPPTLRPVTPPEAPINREAARPIDTGYMGPGQPQQPADAPWSEVAGRAFDYGVGYNTQNQPRTNEGISFETLRNIAENYDLMRLAIETRKNQISKLGWSVLHRKNPGEKHRKPADEVCQAIEKAMRRPDGVHTWDQWIKMVCEDSFVCDGVALYRRRNQDGSPYALELIDPATIKLMIDVTGRSPLPPQPAYAQIIKGMPVAHYTRNELSYWKRNPRSHRVYGHSEVEQVLRTAMLGLARSTRQLGHYNGQSLPDAMVPMPPNWTAQQIAEFDRYFMELMRNPQNKRRVHFVPGGTGAPILNFTENTLFGPFDEWLARVICYAFSLPPFPFVQQTNRATAQSQYDSALEEGLAPFLTALKAFIDHEISEFFGQPHLELVWDDVRKLDPAEQYAQDQQNLRSALASIDDVRAARGQDPAGLDEPLFFGVGPMGFMTAKQIAEVVQSGMNMPQMGMPGGDPLAGAPPELLEQLGIPGGGGAPGQAGAGDMPGGDGAAPADFTVGSSPRLGAMSWNMTTPPEVQDVLREIGD